MFLLHLGSLVDFGFESSSGRMVSKFDKHILNNFFSVSKHRLGLNLAQLHNVASHFEDIRKSCLPKSETCVY